MNSLGFVTMARDGAPQTKGEVVRCARRLSKSSGSAQFLDHMRDRPEEQPGVDLRKFQFAVDDFASAMSEHFRYYEDVRRDKVKSYLFSSLNAIFRCYHPWTLPSLYSP